jgi:spore coat protein JB
MMNKHSLLKQITTLDFTSTDLQLYLNTHPGDAEALDMYNDVIARNTGIRAEYEKFFGPLLGARSADTGEQRWQAEPWPWQEEFNFSWEDEN